MKISKKILAVLLSALILVASMPVVVVAAEELVSDDGFTYTVENGKATITGYAGEATEIVIPDNLGGAVVTEIDGGAFEENTAITSVTFPDTVETIGSRAFYGCTALKSVNLPKSLTALKNGAFALTAIEEIEIPKSLESADYSYFTYKYTLNGVEYSLSEGPFVCCDNLKTVTFEKGTTKVADNLLRGCTGVEEITIPDTVTVIGGEAFCDCVNLKAIDIPDAVTKIEDNAFEGCVSLKSVELSKALTYLGCAAFAETSIESVEIPRALDKCGYSYFTHKYTLNDVEYSVTEGPFVACDNLKTVTFEKGATQIPENLLRGCVSIEEITIPDTVTVVESSAFEFCLNLKGIEIPEHVTKIESNAFAKCVSLKDVKLSKGLTYIGAAAFANTAIESIEIPKSLDKGGYSYSTHNYTLNDTDYSVTEGPFVVCNNLKTVTFEEGTTQIAENLFRGCTGIEKIVIPEGVTVIESSAFENALNLKDITIPSTVTEIERSAFDTAVSLESIVLEDNIISVWDRAFRNCNSLKSFEMKNADAKVGEAVLADNEALTDVKLPANLEKIKPELFKGDIALKTVNIPENVETIGRAAFDNCTALETITIPESVREIDSNAFSNCENLAEVKFADYSVKNIGDSAFAECYALKSIALPKGIEVIGANAFVNCIDLTDVTIPESATEISDIAFSYPTKTTIYSQSGSYVEEYANNGGFNFVDNVVEIETIQLKDGVTKLILEEEKSYLMDFEITPADANEVIKLTSGNDTSVSVDGLTLNTNYWNDTVEITAETVSGAKFTFEVYVRGIDFIRVVEGTYQEQYATGDEFNPDGIKVEAYYSDETSVEINDFVFEGFDSSEPGESEVVVKWIAPDGEEYETYFYVEILGEEPPTLKVQKDENTQITVEAITKAELSVVEITEEISINEVNLMLTGEKVNKLYDITLVEDGEAIQPDGTVKVKIPAVDETSKVYRVEEDGTLTDMNAVYEDGFMVFTTEHFSLYVVTEKAEEPGEDNPGEDNPGEDKPQYEIGDVNMDGKLNIKDVTTIQKHLAKIAVFDAEAAALADFDGNGKLNIKDATTIQKKIAGLI